MSLNSPVTKPELPAISDKLKICIVGVGYVGLPLAVAFAEHFQTLGYDIDSERISELKRGCDRTREVGEETLRTQSCLAFTDQPDDIADSVIYIVTAPTPIDPSLQPDLATTRSATEMISRYLRKGDMVIYESTFYPGLTEEICIPLLEEGSGLRAGQDFGVGYSPERINPSDKTRRLSDIVKLTAGLTPACADFVDRLYQHIITAGTFRAASIRTAEMAKIVENVQRDVNIALINEMAIMCDHMNLRTYEVMAAARTKWNFLPFSPGLVGGHCIGVDPYYLIHKSQRVGHHPDLIISGRRVNNSMGTYIARKVTRMMAQRKIEVTTANVLILGLAFKENCPDIRNTKVLDIHRYLVSMVASVDVYDPVVAPDPSRSELGIPLIEEPAPGHYSCVILAVAHDDFLERGSDWVRSLLRERSLFYDIKSALVPGLVDKTL